MEDRSCIMVSSPCFFFLGSARWLKSQILTSLETARALYMYQAAIPEELGFAKGDVLAVLRHQDDGWWEATIQGGNGQVGLVPSNYLQAM